MATNYQSSFKKEYQKLLEKYDMKSMEYKQLKYEYQLLNKKFKNRNNQLKIAVDNF